MTHTHTHSFYLQGVCLAVDEVLGALAVVLAPVEVKLREAVLTAQATLLDADRVIGHCHLHCNTTHANSKEDKR